VAAGEPAEVAEGADMLVRLTDGYFRLIEVH